MADSLLNKPQIASLAQTNDLVRALHAYGPAERPDWLSVKAIISAGEMLSEKPPGDIMHIQLTSFDDLLVVTDQLISAGIPCDGLSIVIHCEAALLRSVKTAAALCSLYSWRRRPRADLSSCERQIMQHYTGLGKDSHCIQSGLDIARQLINKNARPEPSKGIHLDEFRR